MGDSNLLLNIGGEVFYFGIPSQVYLAYKGLKEFKEAYGDNVETPAFLMKYFNYNYDEKYKENLLSGAPQADRDQLIELLTNRIGRANIQKSFSSNVLVNASARKVAMNLRRYLNILEQKVPAATVSAREAESIGKMKEISAYLDEIKTTKKDRQLEILFQVAWLMAHPNDITNDSAKESWASFLKSLEGKFNLGDLVQRIRTERKNAEDGKTSQAVNYLSGVQLSTVQGKSDAASAKEEFIRQAEFDLQNKMLERLKSIMTVLKIHEYLNEANYDQLVKNISEGKINTTNVAITDISNALVTKISYSMEPLFMYFSKLYPALYKSVSTLTYAEDGIDVGRFPFRQLLNLIDFSMKLTPENAGIIKIHGEETKKVVPVMKKLLSNEALLSDSKKIAEKPVIRYYLREDIRFRDETDFRNELSAYAPADPEKTELSVYMEDNKTTLSAIYASFSSFLGGSKEDSDNTLFIVYKPTTVEHAKDVQLQLYDMGDIKDDMESPSSSTELMENINLMHRGFKEILGDSFTMTLGNLVKKFSNYINDPALALCVLLAFKKQLHV